MELKLEENKGT